MKITIPLQVFLEHLATNQEQQVRQYFLCSNLSFFNVCNRKDIIFETVKIMIGPIWILTLFTSDVAATITAYSCKPSVALTRSTADFFILYFVSSLKDGNYNPNTLMQIEQVKYFTSKYDPNKRVGYLVYDICDDERNAIDVALYLGDMYREAFKIDKDFDSIIESNTVDFAKVFKLMDDIGISLGGNYTWMESKNPLCPCNIQEIRQIFAIVGDLTRDTERAISTILDQSSSTVFYASIQADDLLSREEFPRYMVVVDTQALLAKFTSNLLQYFQWEYVAIIHTDDPKHVLRGQELQNYFDKQDVCYLLFQASTQTLSEDLLSIMEKLKTNKLLRTVIIVSAFTTDFTLKVLRAADTKNVTDKYWLTTGGWNVKENVLDLQPNVRKNILQILDDNSYEGFVEMFLRLSDRDTDNRPWLLDFFGREHSTEKNRTLSQYRNLFDLDNVDTLNLEPSMRIISQFVNQENLEKTADELINSTNHNPLMQMLKAWNTNLFDYAYRYLYYKTLSEKFHFLSKDAATNVQLFNFRSYELSMYDESDGKFVAIATWNNTQNIFTMTNRSMESSRRSPYQLLPSKCAETCGPGYHPIQYNQKACCKDCIRCPTGSYKNQSGFESCSKCPSLSMSHLNRTHCQPLKESYLRFEGATILYVLSGVGVMFTLFATVVYIRYRTTPVVRSSHKQMTTLQLVCHFGLYLSILLFIGRPEKFQCGAQIVVAKLFMTLIIASILVKSERLLRVFQSQTIVSEKHHILTNAIEVSIIIVFTVIQLAIIFLMFVFSGLDTRTRTISQMLTLQIYCDTLTISITQNIYTSMVTLLCMIQAFRARKLPENYNETKFITLAMLCVLLVQLISMPLLASSQSPQAIALTEGLMIFLSNSFLLLLLYGYKVIIILFYPEKNTTAIFQHMTRQWQQKRVDRQMRLRKKSVMSISSIDQAQIVHNPAEITSNSSVEPSNCLKLSDAANTGKTISSAKSQVRILVTVSLAECTQ